AQVDRDLLFQGAGRGLGEARGGGTPEGRWQGSVRSAGYPGQHRGAAMSTLRRAAPDVRAAFFGCRQIPGRQDGRRHVRQFGPHRTLALFSGHPEYSANFKKFGGLIAMYKGSRSAVLGSLVPAVLLGGLLTVGHVQDAAAQAVTPTRWSDPATWPNRKVPAAGDKVVISKDKHVILDVSPPPL